MKTRHLRWLRHLAAGIVTVACLALFARQLRGVDLRAAFADFGWGWLVPGLAALAAGYALRIWRWSLMLRSAGARIAVRDCAAPFLGSIALNNVLPLRLGDAIRALVFPVAMGITRTVATGSLVVERLIDMMTLVAATAIGLLAVRRVAIPSELERLALILALVGGVALLAGLLLSGPIGRRLLDPSRRGRTAVANLLLALDAMLRPRLLAGITLVSLLIWAGEAGLYGFVLRGSGIAVSPATALLVMALTTLATLVPSAPGYVGSFHLAAFAAVTLVGGTAAEAGAYAIVVHLALWLPTTLAGALALWLRPRLFRAARQEITADDPI